MIYFLRAEQDSETVKAGWIKIGTSICLSERLKQIAADLGHTPTVLAVLDGAYAEERALHKKFGHAREWCEWFSPQADLLLIIKTEGRPWDGVDEIPSALIVVKCRRGYKEWVAEYARRLRITPAQLIDRALVKFAKRDGFEPPPDR